jgi:hypothetical protein
VVHWLTVHLHTVLAYGYEVVGGILIFVSSAVTETELPEAKRRKHWILFGVIALVYIAFGIGIKYDDVQQAKDDREELRTLRTATAELTADFGKAFALLVSLNADWVSRTPFLSGTADYKSAPGTDQSASRHLKC